jgi:CDP-diacylglycerol---serine O-phosphatidyltransferase
MASKRRPFPHAEAGHPEVPRRRAAYALPTLFTAGNLFMGFIAIMKTFAGGVMAARGDLGPNANFAYAAVLIGIAVFLDGLDGRIARMTNTVSDFGRELDSLADLVTFGIAPAVLAIAWGVYFVDGDTGPFFREQFRGAGFFMAFFFLVCGASRLARFNIQINPIPKNPGRPGKKYFVGLPIPAAAAMVAAVVYASNSQPITYWPLSVAWVLFLACLSGLMISTWRYRSFKDIDFLRPRSPLTVVFLACLIFLIWNYTQPVLLAMAVTYVGSGIAVRVGGIVRRIRNARAPQPEHQTS